MSQCGPAEMQPCQQHTDADTRDTHPTRTTFGRCPLRPGKEPSIIARRTHSAQCIALLPNPNNKIHPNQKSQKGDKKIRRCSARSKCRSITAKGSSLTTALHSLCWGPCSARFRAVRCWVINADNIECIPSEQPHSRGSDNCAFRDEDLVIECESVAFPS